MAQTRTRPRRNTSSTPPRTAARGGATEGGGANPPQNQPLLPISETGRGQQQKQQQQPTLRWTLHEEERRSRTTSVVSPAPPKSRGREVTGRTASLPGRPSGPEKGASSSQSARTHQVPETRRKRLSSSSTPQNPWAEEHVARKASSPSREVGRRAGAAPRARSSLSPTAPGGVNYRRTTSASSSVVVTPGGGVGGGSATFKRTTSLPAAAGGARRKTKPNEDTVPDPGRTSNSPPPPSDGMLHLNESSSRAGSRNGKKWTRLFF